MSTPSEYPYLSQINLPEDLRSLPESALRDVSNEVREFMVDTITKVGGHFGAGLGVVELTVALHYVFNTPHDKIIIDTGHQGYPHKILTGRKDQLHTIRQKEGLSGFLKRTESEYDVFGAGHASTSISAALGLATARDLTGDDYRVAAVIGDGAMTGGLVYEAMNNCGVQNRDLLVILNDNNMSIAPNVWALSNYFSQIFSSPTGTKLRSHMWDIAGRIDTVGDRIRKVAHQVDNGLKALLTPGMLFEALGFNYFGPINGHNVNNLVTMLRNLKDAKGPTLLHVITQKGKGYAPAEQDKQFLHAIGKVDKITGKSFPSAAPSKPTPPSYQKVFGEAMTEICAKDKRIVGITAAMPDGTGLDILAASFPEQVIDVGIAESHAVTFAAGLACEGIVPVCAIYSSFLQRAFDNIVHDCALQHLHVVFALDRSGLVGADGPTHHGVLDLGYLRLIQGMIVMAPKDEQELRDMLHSAIYSYTSGPSAIRYPRGNGLGIQLREPQNIPLGKGEILKQGKHIALVGIGKMVNECMKAADLLKEQHFDVTVVNARFVKPLDESLFKQLFQDHDVIITVEDGQIQGGFGSAVSEFAINQGFKGELIVHGIADEFVDHGTQEELLADLGLDAHGIASLTSSRHSGN
ncbi:MAG: 1-deoxy-D-xylulose-5-phosphate synthase [Bacteroidetes bacterium]|nr:1-deoxy-D-xylulose-5-phosphate synthase [Bacteroidota bacterium]